MEDLARERAEASGDSAVAKEFIKTYGVSWAKRDLPAAMSWNESHLKGEFRMTQGVKLMTEGASQDFDAAVELWQKLPPGILKDISAKFIPKYAPAHRKAEVEAFIKALSDTPPSLHGPHQR